MSDLSVDTLSYRYSSPAPGCRDAISRVSFTVPSSSSIGLVGPNGAGKTTLAKLLNGVLKPTSGTIRCDGVPVQPSGRPGSLVAYAFQNPDDQLFLPSVRAELEFGPRNLGIVGGDLTRVVDVTTALLGLSGLLDDHPLDLPFVLRKRVSIAAAVAMSRRWTILDEPTLGQDHEFRSRLLGAIAALKKSGRSLLIISHDPTFIFEACDRLLILTDGQVRFQGTAREYAESPPPCLTLPFTPLAVRVGRDFPALRGTTSFATLQARLEMARRQRK